MFNNYDKKFLKDWMYLLREEISDKRLIDLSIPGSINSNIYKTSKIIKKELLKDKTLTPQLEMGIRFLDLHFQLDNDRNTLVNVQAESEDYFFISNFGRISIFLLEHPNEFIVVKLSSRGHVPKKIKVMFILQFSSYLEKYLITKSDQDWFDFKNVKMKDIWKTGKRVLVVSDSFNEFKNIDKYGIFSFSDLFSTYYHDIDFPDLVFYNNDDSLRAKKIKDFLENLKKKDFYQKHNLLLENENIIFENTGKTHYVANKICLKKDICFFLLENKDKNFNYFLLEKHLLNLDIVLALISLNLNSPINIIKAFLEDKDITNQINFFCYNNNSIFLESLKNLKNEEQTITQENYSKFILIYEYQNDKFFYISEDPKSSIFVFYNPLIKKKIKNTLGFGIFIYPDFIFNKIFLNDEDYIQFSKQIQTKTFLKGLFCFKNSLEFF